MDWREYFLIIFMVVLQTFIGLLNQLNVIVILSQADGGGHVDENLKKFYQILYLRGWWSSLTFEVFRVVSAMNAMIRSFKS